MTTETIVIHHQFHGPKNSSNGGYACGRLASSIEGTATVRLLVPPPLDVVLEVRRHKNEVQLAREGQLVAKGWPAELTLDLPSPPSMDQARRASERFRGFRNHRFASCFVCGCDREPGDGLRIFAGPVEGRNLVACTWVPDRALVGDDHRVRPEFLWAVLDCPGGFAFPDPAEGTILLGQLTVAIHQPVSVGESYLIAGWEISTEGRKHYTGTALYSEGGECCAMGKGVWFEVAHSPDEIAGA